MRDVDFKVVYEGVMNQIKEGAFLTVRAGDALNTMTIGWATIGIAWRKPVMMVMVRSSRHTFRLIEKAADFTVSVPNGDAKKALAFCGTKSGRDLDKFKACGLKTAPGRNVVSPIIQIPGIHIECRIVYKNPIDPAQLTHDYDPLYPDKDYHTLYFGEIQACYEV
ncbi:MAG: flavin reductase family protein [Desulfobacterales bacterium]|jgi:flavin reductase (DIM6/NTAB) family NADH-FMN oxidoreductase RutF|nr:flavin reductase family protein [Desulfobacterales bacterium]